MIKKYLEPERVVGQVRSLYRFEESLPGQLFISLLLPATNDSTTSSLHAVYYVFKAIYEVGPLLRADGATYFITARMIR